MKTLTAHVQICYDSFDCDIYHCYEMFCNHILNARKQIISHFGDLILIVYFNRKCQDYVNVTTRVPE